MANRVKTQLPCNFITWNKDMENKREGSVDHALNVAATWATALENNGTVRLVMLKICAKQGQNTVNLPQRHEKRLIVGECQSII